MYTIWIWQWQDDFKLQARIQVCCGNSSCLTGSAARRPRQPPTQSDFESECGATVTASAAGRGGQSLKSRRWTVGNTVTRTQAGTATLASRYQVRDTVTSVKLGVTVTAAAVTVTVPIMMMTVT